MIRICFVVQNVYDTDPRVRRKAESLAGEGYSVDVLALRSEAAEASSYSLNGVNVRTLALGKRRGSLSRYAFEYTTFFFWAFAALSIQMLRNPYDIVDVNTLPDFLIFVGSFARLLGAKLVLDMHEITPEFYISKYGIGADSLVIRALTWLEWLSTRFADHVITINEPIQHLLESRGLRASRSTIIMNSVDETRFARQTGVSGELPRPGERRFVMIYHGTLTHLYGLHVAVEAFALAHREMPGAEFWILGSGTEKTALIELSRRLGVSAHVRFVGQVDPAEIFDWLAQADVGILPILRDRFLDFAFPNKLPELIVMGKPVLISRLKAICHYFSEDALAYFEPNDPTDLSRQMIRLYRDPQLLTALAQKANEEYYPLRWEVMRRRYVDLIEAVTNPRRRTPDGEIADRRTLRTRLAKVFRDS